ncbi:UNVERIFIED_CONTAM: protein WALLS ARE THIN 1 [Sesamum angustifolium]|uniref:WAT1-related protein n=1 Tax=Sesamum angustifolium TaxID=2727405 RepID=A0AAW2LWH4_9LAMI
MADGGVSGSAIIGRRMWSIPEKFQLHLSMLALQFGYAGFHVVSRAALNMGISKIVFPVYRNILAFLLLLPFAYFLEKKERPPLTWNFAVQFFLLAIVGIEKVRLDRKDGMSKVAGTLFCVAGASVITLYKGPTIYSPAPPLQRAAAVAASPEFLSMLGDAKGKNWTLGCIFLIGHCLSWSAWLVLQAPVLKKYPARLSFTSYQCFFGVIQFLGIAAFLERDLQAWLVHSGAELFSVFYAGVVASGIAFAVQIWCIDRGGPVFVAVYQPVQTLVVAIMASFLLGEHFYLGGVDYNWIVPCAMGQERGEKIRYTKDDNPVPTNHSDNIPHIKSSITQPLLSQSAENV